jgi:molecular chaperone DnaK (HSP70)
MSNVSIDADRVLRRGRDDKEAELVVQEQPDRVDEEAARGDERAHELLAADRERQEESDVRTEAASRKSPRRCTGAARSSRRRGRSRRRTCPCPS